MKHSGPFHPRLDWEQPYLYLPATSTDGTGAGLGPAWTAGTGVTVSHPAPTSGFTTQFRRTRFTSDAIATANQELGVHFANADHCNLWRGNSSPLGGFFFSAKFMVNAMEDTDIRFFAGVSASNTAICISDTVQDNTIGLWCDSTDAQDLKLVSRNTATTTKTDLTTDANLTAGVLYEFNIICNPTQNLVVTTLYNLGAGTLLNSQNISSTLPAQTVFLAPQVGLSNAANVGAAATSLDIVSIYARPNLFLSPRG